MSKQELYTGTKWLISRLYSPDAFWTRFQQIARTLAPNPLLARGTGQLHSPPSRDRANRHFARMIRSVSRQDREVAAVVAQSSRLMRAHPEIRDGLGDVLTTWLLSLYVHREKGVYDPEWARLSAPPFENRRTAA